MPLATWPAAVGSSRQPSALWETEHHQNVFVDFWMMAILTTIKVMSHCSFDFFKKFFELVVFLSSFYFLKVGIEHSELPS